MNDDLFGESKSQSDERASPRQVTSAHDVTHARVKPTKNFSMRMRFTLFLHGVIQPLILLCISASGASAASDQPWQSGNLVDYVAMLFKPVAWLPFLPGVLYSAGCLAALIIQPDWASRAWVRLGIYTGVVLSVQVLVLLSILSQGALLVVVGVVWPSWHFVIWLILYFCRRQLSILHMLVLTAVCAAGICFLGANVVYLPFIVFWACGIATPGLCSVAFITAAVHLLPTEPKAESRQRATMPLVFVGWLFGWLVAWRFALIAMLNEYSKLPTTNPNCYLSNAAAWAHPWLTRASGRGQVTIGMRRLKFIELAFKTLAPGGHAVVRRQYDAWCPPLAERCRQSAWLANLTCVCLLPIEAVAEALRMVLQIDSQLIRNLYLSKQFCREQNSRADTTGYTCPR